jgi:hypothetical protein
MMFSRNYRDLIHGSIEISADLGSFVRNWYPLKRLKWKKVPVIHDATSSPGDDGNKNGDGRKFF